MLFSPQIEIYRWRKMHFFQFQTHYFVIVCKCVSLTLCNSNVHSHASEFGICKTSKSLWQPHRARTRVSGVSSPFQIFNSSAIISLPIHSSSVTYSNVAWCRRNRALNLLRNFCETAIFLHSHLIYAVLSQLTG